MKYVMLVYSDQSDWDGISEEEAAERRAESMPRWITLFEEMGKADPDAGGKELVAAAEAKVVRVVDGDPHRHALPRIFELEVGVVLVPGLLAADQRRLEQRLVLEQLGRVADHPRQQCDQPRVLRQRSDARLVIDHLPQLAHSILLLVARKRRDQVARVLDAGVARVVIGSLALTDPPAFRSMLARFGPDRLTLALDVNVEEDRAIVAMHGWAMGSGRTLDDVLGDVPGVRHLLVTDIARDGMLAGPNIDLMLTIAIRYPYIALQASGGVSSLDDLAALQRGVPDRSGHQEVVGGGEGRVPDRAGLVGQDV